MLKTGTTLLPAYSIGNTSAFDVWHDRFGIMEAISRRLKVSVFWPTGRFGLPIPFRTNITMLFSSPIRVEPVPKGTEPTPEQIDEVHGRILDAMKELFDKHKACLGWGHKELKFV